MASFLYAQRDSGSSGDRGAHVEFDGYAGHVDLDFQRDYGRGFYDACGK